MRGHRVRVGPGGGSGGPDPTGGTIAWATGDVLILPAGCTTGTPCRDADRRPALPGDRRARSSPTSGSRPAEARFAPTRFDGAQVTGPAGRGRGGSRRGRPQPGQRPAGNAAHAADAHRDPHPVGHARRPARRTGPATPPPPERGPRPHHRLRTGLLLAGRAPSSTRTGAIVDPERVDWEPAGAFVTPPGPVAQPSQRVGSARLPGPHPGRRPPHLPAVARHPVHPAGSVSPVPRSPARSPEHPVTSPGHRRGGRCRARGHRRAARPGGGDRHPAPRRRPRGHRGHRGRRAPPAGHPRLRRRVGGGHRPRGRGDAGHQPVGRPGRSPGAGRASGHPPGRRRLALRRLARPRSASTPRPCSSWPTRSPSRPPSSSPGSAADHPGLPVVGGYASGGVGSGRHPAGRRGPGGRPRGPSAC